MTRITLPEKRQVGHLTLLRKQRTVSLSEYNTLTDTEQLDMVHAASGREKYDLLINSKHIETLVPQLHPQELYLTVNELGAEYAVELLALASPEQMTLLLDLDCWEGDTLSEGLSLTWLQLLLATGEEKACQLVREMEPELLTLFLKKHLTITRGLEVYDDDDAENAKRLEALYDIDYSSEDAAKIIGALLKIWLEREQDSYLLLMEMIRSENSSVLEEEVYQSRSHRLLDLGIIPPLEARSIYTTFDPETFKPGGKKDFSLEAENQQHPAALLIQAEPQSLLAEILASGLDHPAACELLLLANRKMSADQLDLADSSAVTEAFQEIYSILNLALEYLAGSDIEQAKKIFHTTYLINLFQLGYSLINRYRCRAQALANHLIYQFLDYPQLLFVDSLMEFPAILHHQTDAGQWGEPKLITSRNDLEIIERSFTQIDQLSQLFGGKLPFSLHVPQDNLEPPTLSGLFLTAFANRLLEREFLPVPLGTDDLPRLKALTITGSELNDSFCENLTATLTTHLPENHHFIGDCLNAWSTFFTNFGHDNADGIHTRVLLLKDD